MSNYSEIIVFFLMVPVLMQIVLPLLMLAGYGIMHGVKMLFKRQITDSVSAGDAYVSKKLQATNT